MTNISEYVSRPFQLLRTGDQELDRYLETIHAHAARMLGSAGSHGMDHTERVFMLCRHIGEEEHADMRILLSAALLHDIARPLEKEQGLPHESEGARIAGEYLASLGYYPALIPAISSAIRTHRFSSDEVPETREAKILSDADKLDAMGALGIARTFLRAGEHGTGIDDAVRHFHDKLLRLEARMYTVGGQRIAHERHDVLIRYLEALEKERGVRSAEKED